MGEHASAVLRLITNSSSLGSIDGSYRIYGDLVFHVDSFLRFIAVITM
jgi:hypothetical protein